MVLVNDGLVVLLRGGCTIEGEILIGMIMIRWYGPSRGRIDSSNIGGKKSAIEIDSSIWREVIGNRNRLLNLAGRNRP